MTCYPTVEEVLSAHVRLIARFGGSAGLRDLGALESALARPRSGYYQDLIQEAAALWESLSQNHPFVDGNERVAVTVTAGFLRVNGYRLEFEDDAAYAFLLGLYESGRFQFAELERDLQNSWKPLPCGRGSETERCFSTGYRAARVSKRTFYEFRRSLWRVGCDYMPAGDCGAWPWNARSAAASSSNDSNMPSSLVIWSRSRIL